MKFTSEVRMVDRVVRALLVAASIGLLAGLSFVFMPVDSDVRKGELFVGKPTKAVLEDRSPLRGVALDIPGLMVRRLDHVAVVTFSCDLFDAQQELRPDARARLVQLAKGLQSLRGRIAVEIAGYAPDASDARGYSIGLLRAVRVADCIAGIAQMPREAIALRSLADTEVVGPLEKPHAVVIMVSSAEGILMRSDGATTGPIATL